MDMSDRARRLDEGLRSDPRPATWTSLDDLAKRAVFQGNALSDDGATECVGKTHYGRITVSGNAFHNRCTVRPESDRPR